jgi:hypothetical protein
MGRRVQRADSRQTDRQTGGWEGPIARPAVDSTRSHDALQSVGLPQGKRRRRHLK